MALDVAYRHSWWIYFPERAPRVMRSIRSFVQGVRDLFQLRVMGDKVHLVPSGVRNANHDPLTIIRHTSARNALYDKLDHKTSRPPKAAIVR